jgi:predicted MFS family arabinose efflux permease
LAGAIADSRDTRRLLIGANLVLAAVTLAFCLALIAPWWVVVVVAFLQAVVAQLVAPAEVVLVPSLVPSTSLPAANSLSAANNSLARLLGPAAGGLLYATSGLPAVAVANAVSFAVAALLVSWISPNRTGVPQHPQQPNRPPALATAWPGLAGGWAVGWAEIRRQPLLGRLVLVFVLAGIGEGCVSALLAHYTAEVFGSSTALGLLLTCQAVGGIAGALAMSRWAIIDRLPQTLGAAAIACGVLLALMIGYPLFYPRLWPALLLITIAGLPFAAVAAAQTTLLQTLPHPTVRGSVFGVTIAAAGAAQLVGILAAGYLADRTSVYLLLADAPCYLIAGLLILRPRRPHPTRRPQLE